MIKSLITVRNSFKGVKISVKLTISTWQSEGCIWNFLSCPIIHTSTIIIYIFYINNKQSRYGNSMIQEFEMALTFDLYVNVPGQSRCSPKSIQYIVRKLDMFLKKLSTNCQKWNSDFSGINRFEDPLSDLKTLVKFQVSIYVL